MDANDIFLIIEVNFGENTKEIKDNQLITYEELKTKVMELFNIDENQKDNIEFTYLDEDGDINILDYDNNNIIEASKELMDGNYLLKLNLSLIEFKKDNINLNIERENEILNNEKQKEEKDEIRNNKYIENVKKRLKKRLNKFYKNKLEDIKEKVNEIINEKYDLIAKEIDKFSFEDENGEFVVININDIDEETILKKYEGGKSSIALIENKKLVVIEKAKKSNKEKDENIRQKLIQIKEQVKQLKGKNQINYSNIQKYGDKIYDIMKDNAININDINEYFKTYLEPKEKEKDRMIFINLLDKIYKYIEFKKINEKNMQFFQKEIESDFIKKNNNKENDFKPLLDSCLDNETNFKNSLLQNLNNLEINE